MPTMKPQSFTPPPKKPNVTDEGTNKRKPVRIPEHLTVAEVRQLLGTPYPTEKRDRLILEILVRTGIRASELCNLKTDDVRWDSDEIFVRQGKGRRDRTLPIPSELAPRLKAYLVDVLPGASIPLFGLSRVALHRLVTRYGERAGISRIQVHPHTLRHTYAVSVVKAGVDLRTLQQQLGHSKIATTMIYLMMNTVERRQILEAHPLGY